MYSVLFQVTCSLLVSDILQTNEIDGGVAYVVASCYKTLIYKAIFQSTLQ